MDAEALIAHTGLHAVEQREGVVRGQRGHMTVRDLRHLCLQGGQLVEVSGKEREAADLGGYVSAEGREGGIGTVAGN